MKDFICHCNVSANDGRGPLSAKPTIFVEADSPINAEKDAIKQLEDKYYRLGCIYVSVSVALLKEV